MDSHLGPFADWVAAERSRRPLPYPLGEPTETRHRIRAILGVPAVAEAPGDARVVRRWIADGVSGEQVEWSVGWGPPTSAFVLRPAGTVEPLPGVVALHSHDGKKWSGKDKIADGPEPPADHVVALRTAVYGGRAWANELARRGFVVLAHDVFLWGSRRFPLETMEQARTPGVPPVIAATEVDYYDAVAAQHEHTIEKYCRLLGTTFAAVVSREDRIAAAYLAGRPDVSGAAIGCAGLSGGGARAALLNATCDRIGAAVVVAMMSSYPDLLERHVATHTWMLFPAGLPAVGDWPDVAAARAPTPLLVQYAADDELFPPAGMRAADERLAEHYERAGVPGAYDGRFYPGPHRFDIGMQDEAFDWLRARLG